MTNISQIPIEITDQVLKFRDYLNSCWPALDDLMSNHDWDNDGSFIEEWLQVNWEFLIERELLPGSDFVFDSIWKQRITNSNLEKKYHVICMVNNKIELTDWITKETKCLTEPLLFKGFLKKEKESYGLYPPFDYVNTRSLDGKHIYRIPLDACRFFIIKKP